MFYLCSPVMPLYGRIRRLIIGVFGSSWSGNGMLFGNGACVKGVGSVEGVGVLKVDLTEYTIFQLTISKVALRV